MRGPTTEEIADRFRIHYSAAINDYRAQVDWAGGFAVVLKQIDKFLPVTWINRCGFDEDKQK